MTEQVSPIHRMVYMIKFDRYVCIDCGLALMGNDDGMALCSKPLREEFQRLYGTPDETVSCR